MCQVPRDILGTWYLSVHVFNNLNPAKEKESIDSNYIDVNRKVFLLHGQLKSMISSFLIYKKLSC